LASGELASAHSGNRVKDTQNIMSRLSLGIAALVAVCVAGCADGGGTLSSPTAPSSPLAVATPAAPSSCAVPSSPGDLSVTVTGAAVSLTWSAVRDASDYVVLIGNTPDSSDVLLTNTTDVAASLESVEPGTHFARVHAHNWCGTSDSSDAVAFTIS
jgi:hypothetical protein